MTDGIGQPSPSLGAQMFLYWWAVVLGSAALIGSIYGSLAGWSLGSAINFGLLAIVAGVTFIFSHLIKRWRKGTGGRPTAS